MHAHIHTYTQIHKIFLFIRIGVNKKFNVIHCTISKKKIHDRVEKLQQLLAWRMDRNNQLHFFYEDKRLYRIHPF